MVESSDTPKWLASLRPPWPLSILIALCIFALAIPLFVLVGTEVYRLSASERSRLHGDATRTAERIAADLDQTLNGYVAILATLATSPAIADGNYAVLYEQASDALRPYGLYAFLRDANGQQLFNTRVPFGTPLPISTGFDAPIFQTQKPYVSDLVIGDVAKKPVAAVSVPVIRNGEIKYVLSLSLEPDLLKALLDRQRLPPTWSTCIVDRSNVVLARLRDHDRFLGSKLSDEAVAARERADQQGVDLEGRSVMWGHSKSNVGHWSVYVSVPISLVDASISKVLVGFASIVGLVTALGLAGAFAVGRMVTKPLENATLAAKAFGEGRPVSFEPTLVKEANSIGYALVESARLRAEADQQILLLLREVNHRSKNMLAVVQAIARQMLGSDPKTFVRRLSDRIVGLAASQDLLIESNWQGVRVADLVHSQLFLFRDLIGTRVRISGPPVRVTPAAAQAIGMAMHELATNAGKYGALSGESGVLRITWSIEQAEGERRFRMSWIEIDGPPIAEPTRNGFGHTIIVSMVERALDASVELTYPQTGLQWRLNAPARLTSDGDEVGPVQSQPRPAQSEAS